MKTPICDFVSAYAAADPLRLHMPGHKGVPVLGAEPLDITEVPGADVLYDARGVIAESEGHRGGAVRSGRTLVRLRGLLARRSARGCTCAAGRRRRWRAAACSGGPERAPLVSERGGAARF